MGQQIGNLTNPGSALLNANGTAAMVGDPSKMRDIDFKAHSQLHPFAPSTPDPNQPLPSVGTPTYQQAAGAGAQPGGANALSPGLNKAGKLMTLLSSGLQGALAGRAASEQTVAQTGGRRAGGAGMGFEAAEQYPWTQAGRQQGFAQEQAKTGLLQTQAKVAGQSIPVTLPNGQQIYIPASQIGQYTRGLAGAQVGADSRESISQGQNQTKEDIAGKNIASKEKIAASQQGAPIPMDETVANLAGIPELAGQPVGKATWDNINKALTAKGYKTQDLGQEGLWLLDRAGNRIKRIGDSPGVGRMQALAQSRVVAAAANPEEPGNLTYMSAGQAEKTGALAPQSAPTAAAKRAATSEVPTNVGNLKVAFNTAIQHADLLRSAVTALGNGDEQTLNSLKNRFKTEFGVAGPVTSQAIADAYGREVTSIISKGHITNEEIGSVGKTLNVNRQSPEQTLAVLDAYKALAQSKMNMLQQQVNSAKGNPKKSAGNEIQWHIENGKLVQGAAAPK